MPAVRAGEAGFRNVVNFPFAGWIGGIGLRVCHHGARAGKEHLGFAVAIDVFEER